MLSGAMGGVSDWAASLIDEVSGLDSDAEDYGSYAVRSAPPHEPRRRLQDKKNKEKNRVLPEKKKKPLKEVTI